MYLPFGRVGIILLALVGLGLDLDNLSAAAPPAKLARIQVLGSKRFAPDQIIRASGLKLGAKASAKTFRDAADKLAASGAFNDVSYRYTTTAKGLSVVFRLTDAVNFYPCRFSNFVWFTDQQLQDELRSRVPLYSGQVPLTGSLPDALDAALSKLLESRSIRGTIHHNLYGREGGPIEAIRFQVRGANVLIRRVDFAGATHVDPRTLQEAVHPLLGTDYDQSFTHDFAANNLSPLYWERGFLEVAYDDPRAVLLGDGASSNDVAITIPVREGLQYRRGEIRWSGNTVFSPDELGQYIRVRAGEPANAVEFERDLKAIHEAYGTRGYLNAAVESKPSLVEATGTVNYELIVRQGDLYRMGKLTILGVDTSHTQALARSCRLRAGEPYNKSYWKQFIAESNRHLPPNPKGWKISHQPSVNQATKTVDVTITFAASNTR